MVTRVGAEAGAILKILHEKADQLNRSGGVMGELAKQLHTTRGSVGDETGIDTIVNIEEFLEKLRKFPSVAALYKAQSQMNAQTAAIKKETVQVQSHTDGLKVERDRLRAQYELMIKNKQKLQQLNESIH